MGACFLVKTIEKLQKNGIPLVYNDVARLCKKYHVVELSVFGSAANDVAAGNGDLGLLVSFDDGAKITLFDIIDLEKEFTNLLNRKVEIVEKASLKNPVRKDRILATRELLYAP